MHKIIYKKVKERKQTEKHYRSALKPAARKMQKVFHLSLHGLVHHFLTLHSKWAFFMDDQVRIVMFKCHFQQSISEKGDFKSAVPLNSKPI